jgi:hypothetical protein
MFIKEEKSMSAVSNSTSSMVENSAVAASQLNETITKKSNVTGKTIGNPELSEKAAKYYEELKKKYGNMDFILVSSDMKEQAQAQAGNYANANKMVVLIDEEKIEKMAEDENYRKQYESIISDATSGLAQLQSSLTNTSNVKGYGMKVNDNGTASFLAVIDKSLAAQKERIEKKAEEKKEAKKKADKEETEKAETEKRQEKIEQSKSEKGQSYEDTITVTASSIEELLEKINDVTYSIMSDNVQTDEEKQLGQHIDFRM